MNMEGHIQQADNELAQARLNRDGLVQNLTTLETFAKSFKRNILQVGFFAIHKNENHRAQPETDRNTI